MASFKPLNVKKFYTNNQFKTADLQYWNNLGVCLQKFPSSLLTINESINE